MQSWLGHGLSMDGGAHDGHVHPAIVRRVAVGIGEGRQ